MKTLLALFALLCTLPLRAEDPLDFFPHHIGDTWVYDTGKLTIVKDSIGDDGGIWTWYGTNPKPLYRIDNQYYVHTLPNSFDLLEYKLDAKKGDRWIVQKESKEHNTRRNEAEVIQEYKTFVFGRATTIKEIAYFDYKPGDSTIKDQIYMYTQHVAAGIGVILEIGEAGGIDFELLGCIINGETLGKVTSVDNSEEPKPLLLSNSPNPCHNQTILRFSSLSDARIEIMDILGNIVLSVLQENIRNGENSYSVNTSGWKPGIYFCRLTTGRQTVMRKIIVY